MVSRVRAVALAIGPWIGTAAAAQTAPPTALALTGGANVVSDYRFRGLSRSDLDPAVQASLTLEQRSGLYAGLWGSSVAGYVARGGDAELDLIAGYRRALGGTTIDGGLVYYVYPGAGAGPTDVAEPYLNLTRTLGPLSAKLGANLAWRQRSLGLAGERRGGAYGYAELSAGVPGTGLTLTAHAGHAFAANAFTAGRRYADWSLSAAYVLRRLTLALAYVDTDADPLSYPGDPRGHDIGRAGAVASLGFAF